MKDCPPFLLDSSNKEYKSLLLSKSTWLTWKVPGVNPALLMVDKIKEDFYESLAKSSKSSSYLSNWMIYSSVILVIIWSRLEITFHNFLKPASYESTPMYFNILTSSSYFSWDKADSLSHFFKVSTYDFWSEEPSPERIFLSLSSSLISYWILPNSFFTWFAIIGSAWLISKTFRYSLSLYRIPDGGRRRLLFLNPVELFISEKLLYFKNFKNNINLSKIEIGNLFKFYYQTIRNQKLNINNHKKKWIVTFLKVIKS